MFLSTFVLANLDVTWCAKADAWQQLEIALKCSVFLSCHVCHFSLCVTSYKEERVLFKKDYWSAWTQMRVLFDHLVLFVLLGDWGLTLLYCRPSFYNKDILTGSPHHICGFRRALEYHKSSVGLGPFFWPRTNSKKAYWSLSGLSGCFCATYF